MSRWVLGLNLHHDASACLTRDGVPFVALAQERLNRRKHSAFVTDELVDYCLDAAGIEASELDLVVLTSIWLPGFLVDDPDLLWEWYGGAVQRELGTSFRLAGVKPPVAVLSHHLAHAYAVFGSSGWDEASVLVVDWAGSCRMDLCHPEEQSYLDVGDRATERERVSLYHMSTEHLRVVEKQFSSGIEELNDYRLPLPLSGGIGALYEVVGQFLFGQMFMAGKVMGLAPYGQPRGEPLADADSSVFRPRLEAVRGLIGHRVPPADPLAYADLAASAQAVLEEQVLELADRLYRQTGVPRLAYSGGVALNCVLNSRLEREGPYSELHVVPASNDTGASLGAALYGNQLLGRIGGYVHRSDYLGRSYSRGEIDAALRVEVPMITWESLDEEALLGEVAGLLAEGAVVGWFQGGSEFGPRALGNRSILADARDPAMKDVLNKRVKHREPFRPFGPLVLVDRVSDVFDIDRERPFMLHAHSVRPEWRPRIPSAVHVDGSARLQTVGPMPNPRLFGVLKRFEQLTGVPVLINTSLNIRGEPIVERPAEAIDILRRGHLDALVIEDMLVKTAELRFEDSDVGQLIPRWRDGYHVVERAQARQGCLHVQGKDASLGGRPGSSFRLPTDENLHLLVDGRRTITDILDTDPAGRPFLEGQLREFLRLGLLTLVDGPAS